MENEVRLIDMNTLWQCETCFHHYPNGCDTYCDHGESYRPAADQLTVIDPESLRPKGRWILEAHNEKVNYRWNVTAECSECCDEKKEIWAGFFPGVPDSMAREVSLMDAKQVKLSNYCPNCGAKMEG